MTDDTTKQLSAYLDIFASIPDPIGWYVVPLESYGLLLLVDSRDSMPLPVMEALAGKAGDVIVTVSKPGTNWAGCLIRPAAASLADAAGALRAAYAISTAEQSDDDETGPF